MTRMQSMQVCRMVHHLASRPPIRAALATSSPPIRAALATSRCNFDQARQQMRSLMSVVVLSSQYCSMECSSTSAIFPAISFYVHDERWLPALLCAVMQPDYILRTSIGCSYVEVRTKYGLLSVSSSHSQILLSTNQFGQISREISC